MSSEKRGLRLGSIFIHFQVTFYVVLCFTQVPLKTKTWPNLHKTEEADVKIKKAKASDFDFHTWLCKGHKYSCKCGCIRLLVHFPVKQACVTARYQGLSRQI